MKLSNILKDVLLEAKTKPPRKKDLNRDREEGPISNTVREGVENSIKNRWPLFLDYQGDLESQPFKRWCQPYVLGIRKETGNLTLRCFIYKGKTMHPNKFPGWRTVRLDRVTTLAPLTTAVFNKPMSGYKPNSDDHMSRILLRIEFPGDKGSSEPKPPEGPNAPVDINSDEIKKTAAIIRRNIHGDKVDFDQVEKQPEFKNSKMRRALDVLKKFIAKLGKGVAKGIQNLHLKEDIDNEIS